MGESRMEATHLAPIYCAEEAVDDHVVLTHKACQVFDVPLENTDTRRLTFSKLDPKS